MTIDAITAVRRIEALTPLGDIEPVTAPVDAQPFATFATVNTTFEPWPALADPAAASLAAAASAQHLKTFWQSTPTRERRR
jgi:hypothetical protein